MKAEIKILDSIHCQANAEARKLILPFLKYKSTFYNRHAKFGGKNIEQTCYLISGRNNTKGQFYTGLLPMIKKQIKKNKLNITINGNIDKISALTKKPKLKKETLRTEQLKAIKKFIKKQRGRIVFPTGYGKTFVACGIIKCFLNLRILFLCHTKDLLKQNSDKLNKFDIDHLILDSSHKVDWNYIQSKDSIILLSTDKSISNVDKKYWNTFFDFIIVDESHHAAKESSQYGMILQNCLAPLRLALSATTPTNSYENLVNEGLFGPILAEITNREGVQQGILSKPIMNLIPVPYQTKIANKSDRKYTLYRKFGIVKNKVRNKLIVNEAISSLKNGDIILIIVEDLEHGNILKKYFKKKEIKVPFVEGKMDGEERLKIKNNLKKGKYKIAISSKVWREGIDIPSLNHIIYCAGLKEEKIIKQAIGRGQRTTKDKTTIKVTDFLDPYKFLAEHCILRIQIYKKEGWI